MIGGLSSSMATAIRTAGEARKRMDSAARQLATGQRVSSVKDDGAAWVKANALESAANSRDAYVGIGARYKATLEVAQAGLEQMLAGFQAMRETALAAKAARLSGASTAALQQDYNAARQSVVTALNASGFDGNNVNEAFGAYASQPSPNSGYFYGMDTRSPFAGDPVLGGLVLSGDALSWWSGNSWAGAPGGILANVNFASSSLTDIDWAVSASELNREAINQLAAARGREMNMVDKALAMNSTMQQAGLNAASSLRDADLGKASAQLSQSETRQQLALDTVSRAISAYGNFAGGLLGNVQRTQRGVMV